jgi:predicted DNA-binding protein (UPF0251 family)
MKEQVEPRGGDPALQPFCLTRDEAEAERLLSALLADHAEPIIRNIVRRKLSNSHAHSAAPRSEDIEDIESEVLVQLLVRLKRLRADPNLNAIGDFRGYVAVITYNAYHHHLRQKYPLRWRLKNRLRYLLMHKPEFALWESAGARWLCGFAVWKVQQTERAKSLAPLRDQPQALERAGLGMENLQAARLFDLIDAIFDYAGGPVEMDDLLETVADFLGVKDRPVVTTSSTGEAGDAVERLAGASANVLTELERRLYLQRLWSEIIQLPVRQRIALLLNLRDEHEGVLALFPLTGLVSIRQLAETVAMPPEQFAKLWNDLPLEDEAIATQLGVTRQQVINLRKSARARLARRMKSF